MIIERAVADFSGNLKNGNARDHYSEIDIATVELIHRIEDQQDGYISFCRKVNGEHQDLAGVRVGELRQVMPGLLPWLSEDAYFSVNASYRAAPYKNKLTGLPSAWRKEANLRYLNACYVDLDFYKVENPLEWPEAVKIILQAQEDGSIPLVSIIGRSGRGMYLLWLLTSGRKGAHQRAYPDEIEQYKQINQALCERVNAIDLRLKADRIFDAARILRVPGSVNTKSSRTVQYLVQGDDRGQVPVYTLNELASYFEISTCSSIAFSQEYTLYNRPIVNRGSTPNRRNGRIATGEYRLHDLLTINQHKGGFEQGKRRRSITYFCHFAKAAGWTKSDTLEKARKLAKGCKPPYPSEDNDTPVKDIVNSVWIDVTKKFRNDRLARFFEITPELAEELQLHSIIPAEIKQKRSAQSSKQALKRITRIEAIASIIVNSSGRVPPYRSIQRMLEAQGINASIDTVYRDSSKLLRGPFLSNVSLL